MITLHVGIMSGTSLDGIDIALTAFESDRRAELIGAICLPFPSDLKQALLTLCQPGEDELRRAGLAGNAWAKLAAQGVLSLLEEHGVSPAAVSSIGSHGQTIRHHPELGFSLQIGAPALLAELTNISVVSDFRSRDLAAGGQGAPLVPAFHDWLLSHPDEPRILINIGGFANLTLLSPGVQVTGFDSGPGNVLMDSWSTVHTGRAYDAGGAWARSGKPNHPLLQQMLADPYFSLSGPKSTGREYFHSAWLQSHLAKLPLSLAPADVQATLLELTVESIAESALQRAPSVRDLYVCGGGARNDYLMERLKERLAPRTVQSTEALGVDPDWMEAMAFAWLAWRCQTGQTGNLPAVTGAIGGRVLGAIYPG